MTAYFYPYPPLEPGHLVRRYKRFFAEIGLTSGQVITAHCPNTGPMTGVCVPGSPVQVSYHPSPKRKLAYTWEMIQVDGTWVGVNTALPNRIIRRALEHRWFPGLGEYTQVRSEVAYGRQSRVDFCLEGGSVPVYLEVKNTTWCAGSVALFPDTVTTRGQKHLRELTNLLPQARAVMLYLINRGDCDRFAPGDTKDPTYGRLLRQGVAAGLEVRACRFAVTPEGVRYLGLAQLQL